MASAEPTNILLKDLRSLSPTDCEAKISQVKHLSSYNWVETSDSSPTIAVPGIPPLWSPPKGSCEVPKDKGVFPTDSNAARHASSPLEPLFRALYRTVPVFDVSQVDVITDSDYIRKLLSILSPGTNKRGLEPFTIKAEVVKDTLMFCYHDALEYQTSRPKEGFGHGFKKRYTSPQLPKSTDHHRIISYTFGGLNLVVRHLTGGCVDANTDADQSRTANTGSTFEDNLADVLGSTSLSSGVKLVVTEEGRPVARESTLEIETGVAGNESAFRGITTQLWVSQTSKVVRAEHTSGVFQDPVVEDVAGKIVQWEKGNEKELGQLVTLISLIRSVVKEKYSGRAVVRFTQSANGVCAGLQLKSMTTGDKLLPEDLYAKWDAVQEGNE
ncbi:hypothetical protein BX600DRAFT_552084 [Xylariales sp. PMI_506]|nr:hypothetical protein BX600DRAFT_552084 [Xylariales sp. PMI_506]